MPILESLRQVENEMFDNAHPLANEPLAIREAYAVGYTMLVCVDGYPNELVKKLLKRIITALNLPAKFRKTATDSAMNASTSLVYDILAALAKPEHKYIFMLDLYKYAFQDKKITEQEQEFLLLFERLFELSPDELHFVRGFRLAMLKKNIELAYKVVHEAKCCDLPIPLQDLQYFLKGFEHWKHVEHKEVDKMTVFHSKTEL